MLHVLRDGLESNFPPTAPSGARATRDFMLLGGAATVGWPLAAAAQLTTPPTRASTMNPPQMVVRVKPIDPVAPRLRFQ
jgi:hypothetical protein